MRSKKEDFIGWKSPDGNLEVIGIAGKGKDGRTLYKIACKLCSEDKELFPVEYFISNKNNLVYNNQCPCGCSFSPKWNKEQYIILAKREAKERFIIHGFTEEFNGVYTKISCECIIDGFKWETSLNTIINKGCGCKECAKREISSKHRNKEAIGNCIKACDEEGYTFVGFDKGYKNSFSRLKYICPVHGEKHVSYNNFVNHGSRCPDCAKEEFSFYGYYKDRVDKLDNLYILNFDNNYIKVGRSFEVKNRLVTLRYDSGCKNIKVMRVYRAKHSDVFKIEQEIHTELRAKGFEHHESTWSTETFNNNCLCELNEILQRYKNILEEI